MEPLTRTDEEGSSKRRLKRWLIFSAVCVVAFCLTVYLTQPRPLDSAPQVERLLTGEASTTPFSAVLLDRSWDTVCYLDPYSFPSRRLPVYLNEALDDFVYEAFDQWIGEEESALAFIDHKKRKIYIYSIANKKIRTITGERCLNINHAKFFIEYVNTSKRSYRKLAFVFGE